MLRNLCSNMGWERCQYWEYGRGCKGFFEHGKRRCPYWHDPKKRGLNICQRGRKCSGKTPYMHKCHRIHPIGWAPPRADSWEAPRAGPQAPRAEPQSTEDMAHQAVESMVLWMRARLQSCEPDDRKTLKREWSRIMAPGPREPEFIKSIAEPVMKELNAMFDDPLSITG